MVDDRCEKATESGSHTEVFCIDAGSSLQQDVGSVHVSCQHGAVQRRVSVHLVHGAQRRVVFNQELRRFWPGNTKQFGPRCKKRSGFFLIKRIEPFFN